MDESTKYKLIPFLKLLSRHRGDPKDAYNEVAHIYDDFAQVWDYHIAGPAMAYYNQTVESRARPDTRILDAGAGTGERTLALLKYGQPGEIVALDASEEMLNVARRKIHDPRVQFQMGDITKLPFEDNTFDVVSCTWAIEIMDDPRVAVQEFVRVVKSDGFVVYVFCSLPEGKIGHALKYVIDKISPDDSPLSHLLTEEERPFHRCGFSSLKQFSGGLTTVATVGKCCSILEPSLPCHIEIVD